MCRILGYLGKKEVDKESVVRAINNQLNGGPDAQTFAAGNEWLLSNNRLAIQGLDGGSQPFASNKIHAVYNGEIYNHKELKAELSNKGYHINDHCDGSVIIPMYEVYGDNFVKHLDGMFAIAIIDEREDRKLLLAVDTSAVKSLYYYEDKITNTLFFASELNSLLALPIPKTIRKTAINEYLVGRTIWHNQTFFDGIYSMGPSSLLIKENGKEAKKETYFSLLTVSNPLNNNFSDSAKIFDDLLHDEIKKMCSADVPVCLVTSGGLDSSLVTAIATKYKSNIECFNVAYDGDWPDDERRFAKEISDSYGIKHNQVLIEEQQFPGLLTKTIEHIGQPNSAPHSLSTYALFQSINEAGFKVAITGEGADEYFGGYDRFRKATYDNSSAWLSDYFDVMCATTCEKRDMVYSNEYIQFLKNAEQPLDIATNKILNLNDSNSKLKSILKFDQLERFPSYILKRVDHLSMANSVEVRVPFCQPKITSYASSLPDNYLLDTSSVKKIIYEIARSKLPESIINRPKQPFTLPIVAMLKKGHVLFDILIDTLQSKTFYDRGFFNKEAVTSLIAIQESKPNPSSANMLWSLMILELWLKRHAPNFRL